MLMLIPFVLTSCLYSNLPKLPAYHDAKITNFHFEYKWAAPVQGTQDVVHVYRMQNNATISNDTVYNSVTIPAANNNFPDSVRSQVSLKDLTGYCDISTGATIMPMGSAPALGGPGNFSQPLQYRVVAADGNTNKVWTIVTILK